MTPKDNIIKQIDGLSEYSLGEVSDFIEFLKVKENAERYGTAVASETSLKKDWLRPEEEDAWKNL